MIQNSASWGMNPWDQNISVQHNKRNSDVTRIVAILDTSGSMMGSEADIVGSYNNFISDQKELDRPATVTLIKFASIVTTQYEQTNLMAVPIMPKFKGSGATALNDAIDTGIRSVPDGAANVIVLIQTDGEENSSRISTSKIRRMIEEKQSLGWEFLFIGAELSEFQMKHYSYSYGFNSLDTLSVGKSPEDFATAGAFMSYRTTTYRTN